MSSHDFGLGFHASFNFFHTDGVAIRGSNGVRARNPFRSVCIADASASGLARAQLVFGGVFCVRRIDAVRRHTHIPINSTNKAATFHTCLTKIPGFRKYKLIYKQYKISCDLESFRSSCSRNVTTMRLTVVT